MRIRVSSLFTILLFSSLVSFSQSKDFLKIDKLASNIPDSAAYSLNGISRYIDAKFFGSEEKLRAIYVWISTNIFYDVTRMNTINYYQNREEIITEALKHRKGICTNYAFLFNALAQKVGIKSYVIFGRSKQLNKVDNIPHAWCAAKIDSSWFLFDPTWGAGNIDYQNKFNAKFSDQYFKQTPENFIKEHFPFDPLWQFLNRMVTFNEFTHANNPTGTVYFNYIDSLRKWDSSTKIDQLKGSIARTTNTDEKDQIVADHLDQVRAEIENLIGENFLKKFNSAVLEYNESLGYLNQFITERNKQTKDIEGLKRMMVKAQSSLNRSKSIVNNLNGFDSESKYRLDQISRSITSLQTNIKTQQNYLNKLAKK